jgi:hypothetical protein
MNAAQRVIELLSEAGSGGGNAANEIKNALKEADGQLPHINPRRGKDSVPLQRSELPAIVARRDTANDLYGMTLFREPRPRVGRKFDRIILMRDLFLAGTWTPEPWGGPTPMSLSGFWVDAFCQGGAPAPVRDLLYRLQLFDSINNARTLPERDCLFVVAGGGSNDFFHSLVNTLPSLRWYEELKLECPILLPRFWPNIRANLLEAVEIVLVALGIPKNRLISNEDAASSRWCWGILPNQGDVSDNTVGFLRRVLGPAARGRSVGPRIYISRQSAKRRRIINEDAIIEVVKRYGYRPVELERLAVPEQVGVFRGARSIVGPHGAGLAHVMFAESGATVVEIFPKGSENFRKLSAICGHQFTRIPAVCPDSHSTWKFEAFAELERLCAASAVAVESA